MIVYAETNFVLELALLQEEAGSCEQILRLAEHGIIRLVLPAFSLAEPFGTLDRRKASRNRVSGELQPALRELARTEPYRPQVRVIEPTLELLLRESADHERDRLNAARKRIVAVAETIPLDSALLTSAVALQDWYELSPQDAVVYASVLAHLQAERPERSCFVNRNAHDFARPVIADDLRRLRCKMLTHFDQGYGYILSVP